MKRIFVAMVVISLALAGCAPFFNAVQGNRVIGSGKVVSETRPVSGFNSITVTTSGDVKVTQGDSDSLVIEAEDNILPLLVSEVNGSELVLKTKPNTSYTTSRGVHYIITVKDLRQLTSSGSADVQASDIQASSFSLVLTGSGNVTLASLQTGTLSVEVNGSGNARVNSGGADQATVHLTGSGNFTAPDLQIQSANVTVSGSGTAGMWVKSGLRAILTGSGDLEYYGSPTVNKNVSGSGKVVSRGDK